MTDWLKNTLTRHLVDDSADLQEDIDSEFEHRLGDLDFEYELADVVEPVYDLYYYFNRHTYMYSAIRAERNKKNKLLHKTRSLR